MDEGSRPSQKALLAISLSLAERCVSDSLFVVSAQTCAHAGTLSTSSGDLQLWTRLPEPKGGGGGAGRGGVWGGGREGGGGEAGRCDVCECSAMCVSAGECLGVSGSVWPVGVPVSVCKCL